MLCNLSTEGLRVHNVCNSGSIRKDRTAAATNHHATMNAQIEKQTTNMKQTVLTLVAALSLAGAAFADQTPDHKVLVLKNKDGLAIQGYDPVAYFTDSKPAKGSPKLNTADCRLRQNRRC